MNKWMQLVCNFSVILTTTVGLESTLLASSPYSSKPPLRIETFANHTAINLKGTGPFYQSDIPVQVYESIQQDNLGDVRVFNGEGEVVPYALISPLSTEQSQAKEIKVPFFILSATKEKSRDRGDLSLKIKRNQDGTLIALNESSIPPLLASHNKVQGVIVDVSQIQDTIEGLRLEAGASTVPFHSFTVETSNDLQQWHVLASQAQWVRLEQAGQSIEKNMVEWDGSSQKYLRVLWADPEHAPPILSISLKTRHTDWHRPTTIWSEAIQPTSIQKNSYEYVLPGRLPLELVRIHLNQTNTLAPVILQKKELVQYGRHRDNKTWVTLVQSVVYRLQSPTQETVLSPDIVINGAPEEQLRLSVDDRSGGLGSPPPTLQVGFIPKRLVFLARGKEPFVLAWGAAKQYSAALPIDTLMPNYQREQPLEASTAELQPIQLKKIQTTSLPTGDGTASNQMVHKAILWGMLVLGVVVLGGMASALMKQMKQQEKEK